MYLGKNKIVEPARQAEGRFVDIDGEKFYQIADYDTMQPFFISLASDTDLWMYISSTGGLTCGRQSPDKALFPYYTDDKITEQYEMTGPKTIIRATREGNTFLWEPFSERQQGLYHLRRTIAKNTIGNKLLFTETNIDLSLTFKYLWCASDRHGWVRKATLINTSLKACSVELIDGLQNVLPAGVDHLTQNTYSTLVDGYKKTELVEDTSLVLFRMEAILVDRAEPSESLRCNTVYCVSLPEADYLLSSRQLRNFRTGAGIVPETESKGVRGAIFSHAKLDFQAGEQRTWYFVADVAKDAVQVRRMINMLSQDNLAQDIEAGMAHSRQTLCDIVGQNDGFQHTADEHNDARHFANTLFNTMRGGFYCDDYEINGKAFANHVRLFNREVAARNDAVLHALPEQIQYADLLSLVINTRDKQLHRLALEYLPLTFSRRHGDPSRPWNLFNIRVNDQNGKRIISYQGNWRDIFQNWEALSLSYPLYINGIIAKFLNATTIDGYNPYKITSEGIDWEVIEPDNPWSNIGYWGDHQIIYLLKLLELSYHHNPQALRDLLNEAIFAFANVPYRLKTFDEIVRDPKNSIRFDAELHNAIFAAIPTYGEDARLVRDAEGGVQLATMAEKLLIPLLAKLGNFIPAAGIWMNTLRPEWNDANNALVGYGASMVTLCYMRRYVNFIKELFAAMGQYRISADVEKFVMEIMEAMRLTKHCLNKHFTDEERYRFTEIVGRAAEHYRNKAYQGYSTTIVNVSQGALNEFFDLTLRFIDHSINANKRSDGLYNAYNLVQFSEQKISVETLYPMLEGQVAVLSSGTINATQVAELLDSMRTSDLYRPDQNSYMLYPNRRRPSFLEKNNICPELAKQPVIQRLLKEHKGIIVDVDDIGGVHFNADFNNADFMFRAVDKYGIVLNGEEHRQLADIYEQTFHHHAFTGRSGTFYKYEGLGCIYWHMVSKLLLAVGENIRQTQEPEVLQRLKKHYRAIRDGIGSHKTPQQYGSFPFDAYSHTPSMAGVQQPGMTGQVKEDIINRFFELGIEVINGEIHIVPTMIQRADFIDDKLDFTYCAVMFEYFLSDQEPQIAIEFTDGTSCHVEGSVIPGDIATLIFSRSGKVKAIKYQFQPKE